MVVPPPNLRYTASLPALRLSPALLLLASSCSSSGPTGEERLQFVAFCLTYDDLGFRDVTNSA